MTTKSLFSRTEPSLHELLLRETTGPDQQAYRTRLLAFRAALRSLSSKITGASRRAFPDPRSYAPLVTGLADMVKGCPPEIQGELDLALRDVSSRMKLLVTGSRKEQGQANSDPVGYARKLLAGGLPARRGQTFAPRTKKTVTPDFQVFAGPLKVKSAGDRPVVTGIASSTAIDLEGDRFTLSSLKQMASKFVGMTSFIGHRYIPPEDIFGVIRSARLVEHGKLVELHISIDVAASNPRAAAIMEQIADGVRMGISVGVIVLAHRPVDEDGERISEIVSVQPLEASIVGIPANQTAWVTQATRSLKRKVASR